MYFRPIPLWSFWILTLSSSALVNTVRIALSPRSIIRQNIDQYQVIKKRDWGTSPDASFQPNTKQLITGLQKRQLKTNLIQKVAGVLLLLISEHIFLQSYRVIIKSLTEVMVYHFPFLHPCVKDRLCLVQKSDSLVHLRTRMLHPGDCFSSDCIYYTV